MGFIILVICSCYKMEMIKEILNSKLVGDLEFSLESTVTSLFIIYIYIKLLGYGEMHINN